MLAGFAGHCTASARATTRRGAATSEVSSLSTCVQHHVAIPKHWRNGIIDHETQGTCAVVRVCLIPLICCILQRAVQCCSSQLAASAAAMVLCVVHADMSDVCLSMCLSTRRLSVSQALMSHVTDAQSGGSCRASAISAKPVTVAGIGPVLN